jgi:hypothetical protein
MALEDKVMWKMCDIEIEEIRGWLGKLHNEEL